MVKALSIDLRERVISAVCEGASRHEAAARFGVSASSAIRWVAAWRLTGSSSPKPIGGDRRSHHLEQHAGLVLTAIEDQADITINELQVVLKENGVTASFGAIWNLLARHNLTYKKRQHTLPSKNVRMSQPRE